MLKFYGHDKCGTCRKARQWLDGHGLAYTFIDITQTPPPKTELRALARQYGLKALFNTSGGQYRELGVKDKLPGMSEADAVTLLAGNGMLCKRPVVTDGTRRTVGFREATFAEVWTG
jgi:arsenate reductase